MLPVSIVTQGEGTQQKQKNMEQALREMLLMKASECGVNRATTAHLGN